MHSHASKQKFDVLFRNLVDGLVKGHAKPPSFRLTRFNFVSSLMIYLVTKSLYDKTVTEYGTIVSSYTFTILPQNASLLTLSEIMT